MSILLVLFGIIGYQFLGVREYPAIDPPVVTVRTNYTGANAEDMESSAIHAAGLIIRDLPLLHSSWRSAESLQSFLERGKVVAIADIDTRRLTRVLREKGAQAGCIMTGENVDEAAAVRAARLFPGLKGMDLAKVATTRARYEWTQGSEFDPPPPAAGQKPFHVVAFDYGIKHNILRLLVDAGCRVTVLPAETSAEEALALAPEGVFLSNGPGDPQPCDYAIRAIRRVLEAGVPVFGICLGHQLLGLASGAATVKMKFGHHGANHPVQDLQTGRVLITSQNHGFAIDEATLPANLRATHRSLFDGTLQGVARTDCDAFSFQGHPEASPGPQDVQYLFGRFTAAMQRRRAR
jgi:carbamoyl-phosphate synthase small subunit